MLVRLPRRSSSTDKLGTIQRTRQLIAFVLLFLLACSSGTPEFFVLDARESPAQITLQGGDQGASFWVIPFSSNTSNVQAQADYAVNPSIASGPYRAMEDKVFHEKNLRRRTLLALEGLRGRINAQNLRIKDLYRKNPATNGLGAENLSIVSPFQGDAGNTISAKLLATSGVANIYVDSRYESEMTQASADRLLRNYSTITLPRLRTFFGQESDIDGNGKINIFFSSPEKIGTNVVGFFQPLDLLPLTTSNQQEIVYVRIPDQIYPEELFDATLAHEAFHLINFGQKSLKILMQTNGQSIVTEDTFLNEGLAHLAEEITGWGVCTVIVTKKYLECLQKTSLAGLGDSKLGNCAIFSPDGDSLARRGGAMLFLLYLFQQTGGAVYSEALAGDVSGAGITLLNQMNRSPTTGLKNIESSSGRSFFIWYADFVAAVAVDSTTTLSPSRFRFDDVVTDTFTHLPRNIRMSIARVDPSGDTYEITGPADFREITAAESIPSPTPLYFTGANFFKLSISPGGEKRLVFSDTDHLGLGATVIKIP